MAIKFFAFFFPTISTFGCFWSQWPTSLAVTSGCPTMRGGRLPSRSDVNIGEHAYITILSMENEQRLYLPIAHSYGKSTFFDDFPMIFPWKASVIAGSPITSSRCAARSQTCRSRCHRGCRDSDPARPHSKKGDGQP